MKYILLTLVVILILSVNITSTYAITNEQKIIPESSLSQVFVSSDDLKWAKKYLEHPNQATEPWKSASNSVKRAYDVLEWFKKNTSMSERKSDPEQGRLEDMLDRVRIAVSDRFDEEENRENFLRNSAKLYIDLLSSKGISDVDRCPVPELIPVVREGGMKDDLSIIPKIAQNLEQLNDPKRSLDLARMFTPNCNQLSRHLFQLSLFEKEDLQSAGTASSDARPLIAAPDEKTGQGGCLSPMQLEDARKYLQKMIFIRVIVANGGRSSNGAGHVGDSANAVQALITLGFKGKFQIVYNAESPGQMKAFYEKFGFASGCSQAKCGAEIVFTAIGKEEIYDETELRRTKKLPGWRIEKIQHEEDQLRIVNMEKILAKDPQPDLTLFAGADIDMEFMNPYEDQLPFTLVKSKNTISVNEMHWVTGSTSRYIGRKQKDKYYAKSSSDTGLYMPSGNDDRKKIIDIREIKSEEERKNKATDFVEKAISPEVWESASPALSPSTISTIKALMVDSIIGKNKLSSVYGLHNAVGASKDRTILRFAKASQSISGVTPVKVAIVAANDLTASQLMANQELAAQIRDLRGAAANQGGASVVSPEVILLPRLPKPVYELLVRTTSLPVLVEGTGSAAEAAADNIPHVNIGNIGGTELYVGEADHLFRNDLSKLTSSGR
ncbi:MAG: hypothetical protein HQK52_21125 [Oligoflexia bacterium]|nr:hypothetical protein [Oligoflexia bacterium]